MIIFINPDSKILQLKINDLGDLEFGSPSLSLVFSDT